MPSSLLSYDALFKKTETFVCPILLLPEIIDTILREKGVTRKSVH